MVESKEVAMQLAIAGGTGTVGAHLVRLATEAGHQVKVLARSQGVDLVSNIGIDLTGVDAVIDVSGPRGSVNPSEFFQSVTKHLLHAEEVAGVKHHVALSIVGAAEHPYGYYAGKALQELLVAKAAVPWTVLRATQFFEFAEKNAKTFWRWAFVVKMVSRPVAAESVAQRLLELATGEPRGMVPEFAGPDEMRMAELARMVFETHADPLSVIEIPLPGSFGKTLRDGGILPGPDADIDGVTYEDWLAAGAR